MGGCSVQSCKSSTYKGMRLFRFPRNDSRRKIWSEICRRGTWQPTINSRICSLHFSEDQFEKFRIDGWKKLKPNAVPTIFSVSTNEPNLLYLYGGGEPEDVLFDHSYTGNAILSTNFPEGGDIKCAIATCTNTFTEAKQLKSDIDFYNFPQDERLKNSWIEVCHREDVWIPDTSAICSVHFLHNDFELEMDNTINIKAKRKLKEDAIPTLHLQEIKTEPTDLGGLVKIEEKERSCDEEYKKLREEHEILKSQYGTLEKAFKRKLKEITNLKEKVAWLTGRLSDECASKKQLEEI